MRDTFINDPSIEAINNKINQDASLTDKKIALSVELVTINAWQFPYQPCYLQVHQYL